MKQYMFIKYESGNCYICKFSREFFTEPVTKEWIVLARYIVHTNEMLVPFDIGFHLCINSLYTGNREITEYNSVEELCENHFEEIV